MFREGLEAYRLSLPDIVRVLFDRYRLEDWALKVVGIGSVGTRCMVALVLLRGRPSAPPAIQGGPPSVLAPYAGKSVYENQGQRVVIGQRLMQSASDIFLGWARGRHRSRFLRAPVAGHEILLPDRGMLARRSLKRYAESAA